MPSVGRGKSVYSLRETEGSEQVEEDEEDEEGVRRQEQTKKEEGLRHRRKWSLPTALPSSFSSAPSVSLRKHILFPCPIVGTGQGFVLYRTSMLPSLA